MVQCSVLTNWPTIVTNLLLKEKKVHKKILWRNFLLPAWLTFDQLSYKFENIRGARRPPTPPLAYPWCNVRQIFPLGTDQFTHLLISVIGSILRSRKFVVFNLFINNLLHRLAILIEYFLFLGVPKVNRSMRGPFSSIVENKIPNCEPDCTPEFCSMWPDAVCSAT